MLTKTQIKKYQDKLEKIKSKLQKEIREDEKAPNFGKDFERPEDRAEEAEAEFTALSLAEEFKERWCGGVNLNKTKAAENSAKNI